MSVHSGVNTARIETKIENYERTQRRRYNKAAVDVTTKENAADAEGAIEIDEVNTAATNENEAGDVEMKDATTNTAKKNADESEAETYTERITGLTAGIETKIENYESKRTQRRHYNEAEEIDVTTEENAADAEAEAESETEEEETTRTETEEAVRVEEKRIEDENTETVEAARVERKEIESCEGVLSHRKHFPGSTTSHIFG